MKVSCPEFISQWHNMLEYALTYIKLSGVSYLVAWKKLFTSPKKNEWSDALFLVELLFSIPVVNAKLERMFLKLKRIKTIFQASLSSTRVENLLCIVEDGLPLVEYNVMPAVEAWAAEKYRYSNQQPRKTYEKKTELESGTSEDELYNDSICGLFDSNDDLHEINLKNFNIKIICDFAFKNERTIYLYSRV